MRSRPWLIRNRNGNRNRNRKLTKAMPVLINELIIRTLVTPDGARQGGQSSQPEGEYTHADSAHDQAEIVQACVREVMRLLAVQRER